MPLNINECYLFTISTLCGSVNILSIYYFFIFIALAGFIKIVTPKSLIAAIKISDFINIDYTKL
jgi:hypothetical protein